MKSCCVPLCENDTYNRPDLKYFPLPKKVNVRKEWLELLGIKGEYRSQQISICEIHFRDVDFRAGRKELKVHAVPVLYLQKGIIDHIGDEGEFIPDESDCKPPELLDGMIKDVEQKKATPSSAKKRRMADEIIIKQEPESEPESETGRRPSRRAALVAAKKISSTVRQCGVKDDDPEDPTLHPTNSTPKNPASSRKSKVDHVKQNKVDLDLEMICEDEELSSIQCTFLKLAQDEYNLTLKNLRELAACNVRIIQEGDKATHIDLNAPINLFAPNGRVLQTQNKPKSSQRRSTQISSILAKNSTKSNVPIIYL